MPLKPEDARAICPYYKTTSTKSITCVPDLPQGGAPQPGRGMSGSVRYVQQWESPEEKQQFHALACSTFDYLGRCELARLFENAACRERGTQLHTQKRRSRE